MKVGIGLPNAVPGTTGAELVEFARRAEARGFAMLGTIDRIVYPNYEPLAALTAAAAVTERIELFTSVLLGPLRGNAAALAKQALSVHAISGGRLTLGIALGARGDDYELAEVPTEDRGERLTEMLEKIEAVWADERVGPRSEGTPSVLVGGSVEASFKRAARFGAGWIAGGAPPDAYAEMSKGVHAAWSEAGREGEPRMGGLGYFALGEGAEKDANSYLTDYYAFLGDEMANMIAGSAAKDADTVRGYLSAFEEAGCGEYILFPSSSDPDQVDLLADAAGL